MADYYCNACGRTVQRDSEKRWIKSYCETTGRTSRLWRRVPQIESFGPDGPVQ